MRVCDAPPRESNWREEGGNVCVAQVLAGAGPERKRKDRKKNFQDRTRKLNKIQWDPKKNFMRLVPENLGIGRFQLETGLWG
jgi:hypothetical protein